MKRADIRTPNVYWLVHGTGLTVFKEAEVIAYFDLDDCEKIKQGIEAALNAREIPK